MADQSMIRTERDWQKPRALAAGAELPRVVLTRWSGGDDRVRTEVAADHADLSHFITYSLARAEVDFTIGSAPVTRGTVLPGRVLLQGPTDQRRQSVYSSRFDFFRIYLSQPLLQECLEDYASRGVAGDVRLFGAHFIKDAAIKHMTESLLAVDETGGALGQSYVDAVGLALAWSLIARHSEYRSAEARLPVAPLSAPRLKRVLDYVDAHLGGSLSLAELSGVAGLSRIHFSAQFREAMGQAPYAWILRRRVEAAKPLLAQRSTPIIDIALGLGFSNQAHFTDAFRRMVGVPPARWRASVLG